MVRRPVSCISRVPRRRLGVWLALGSLLMLATWPLGAKVPEGLQQEGRLWLIPPIEGEAAGPVPKPLSTASIQAERGTDFLRLKTTVGEAFLKEIYALRVKIEPERPIKVTVNDRRLDADPVRGEDGLYYMLVGHRLVSGENSIEIRSLDGGPLGTPEVEAFSLVDSFEEVHFHQAFGPPVVMVQPPTHADQEKYDAQHYELDIILNMSSTVIDSTLTMTAESLDSTLQSVPLDLNDNGGSMSVGWVDQGPSTGTLPYTLDGGQERLFVTLPAAVPSGSTFVVRVKYGGVPSSGGVFGAPYRVSTHGSPPVPIVYTFSQPYGARHWWPCKDVPDDKATMDLHITCPTAYTAISNGVWSATRDNGDGTHTFDWSETYPMVTYLASICCTNYQPASGTYTSQDGLTTMEVAHYLYPENYASESSGVSGTLMVMDFFAQTFGEYPFLSEKYYTATHNITSSMEHQTATSLRPYGASSGGLTRSNIHELAHMWFGDMITMEHFDHLWLNEGFGTYLEALWEEDHSGTAAYHTYVNNWSTSDAYPLVSSSADNFSGSIVYRKGAWVLHMLRHVVEYYTGDDADFFQAVLNYASDPNLRYGCALSIDLENHFESHVGEDLTYFFQQWLYRAVRPTYQWAWSTHSEGASNILDLYIHQTQGGGPYTMPVDFRVSLQGGGTQLVKVFNDQSTQFFGIDLGSAVPTGATFDPDNWILDNSSEVAYPSQALQVVISSALDQVGNGDSVVVSWQQSPETAVSGYELYQSEDLSGWTLVADEVTLPRATTSYAVSGLSEGSDYYFRLRAVSSTLTASDYSDVYGCRPTSAAPEVLIVEGYDRWDNQSGRGGSFEGVYYHGQAIDAYGASFDSCDNDEVGTAVNLSDYPVVVWVLGEESRTDETFSDAEQPLVSSYLDGGGNLFVSGAEIAWDLDYYGSSSDQAFYNGYLKADYVGDDANTFQAQGTGGSILSAVPTFNFGTGVGHAYYIEYADRLGPLGGSSACLTYVGGTADTAAIQYAGTYKLVYLGFPFETIVEQSAREAIMAAALEFFGLSDVPSWTLY